MQGGRSAGRGLAPRANPELGQLLRAAAQAHQAPQGPGVPWRPRTSAGHAVARGRWRPQEHGRASPHGRPLQPTAQPWLLGESNRIYTRKVQLPSCAAALPAAKLPAWRRGVAGDDWRCGCRTWRMMARRREPRIPIGNPHVLPAKADGGDVHGILAEARLSTRPSQAFWQQRLARRRAARRRAAWRCAARRRAARQRPARWSAAWRRASSRPSLATRRGAQQAERAGNIDSRQAAWVQRAAAGPCPASSAPTAWPSGTTICSGVFRHPAAQRGRAAATRARGSGASSRSGSRPTTAGGAG
mmetsp:Transcript_70301/g.222086  ORF Transcript_70301/g.222086 Transcript_70301/m.222086 type:complete len:301 (+) Transcript_70301:127-1029(+)